ncbi:hypothetical protein [Tropicimonas sp. IMCC6043]|uniref:hypothetical protein n=1 Tax=Tropicimonas sp. IMCC6043 TaxID=2510645 RepID=UPI00101CD9B5|nr:hypothetical protein [Tropicimonas sp. IMCC6043]RYH09023.1 hypothetical protein EU800_13670 [Tropicimonas sp. IMCC6043]
MWFLRTITLVPRPTAIGAAPFLVTLVTFLVFRGWTGTLLGRPLAPLPIAAASGFAVLIVRNVLFNLKEELRPDDLSGWMALYTLGIFLCAALLFSPDAATVQKCYTVYLLAMSACILAVLRFWPEDIHHFPSVWATRDAEAVRAMPLVALGYALRAIAADWVAMSGTETLWILFVTLGSLAIHFLTNWVILLYLYVRRTGR